MSFLPLNNQENKEAPQGQTTPNPAGEAPPQAGGSVGSEGVGPKVSAGGTPTQFGSSASKLGDYLSANAPQITNQANTLAGNLNTQYGQLSGDISKAANQFGQQVQGGYAAPNQGLVQQAIANPTGFAADPNNVNAFKAQYNNQYTGPQNFESTAPYSNIQNAVSGAVQQGNLLGSQAGLQSYLQGQQKNPTRASSTLDSLLLGGNPEASATVQNAAKQFSGLTGQLESAKGTANQSVQDAQKAAQESQAYAKGQFDPYVNQFKNQLTNEQQNALNNYSNYNTGVQGYQSNLGNVQQLLNQFPELLNQYGAYTFTDNWQQPVNTYPTAPQFGPAPQIMQNMPTLEQVASPEEYAQAAALQQLGGNSLNLPISNATQGQAGTWASPGAVPTNQAFIDALTGAQNWATGPQANNIYLPGSAANVQPFLQQGNDWYQNLGNLLQQLGGTPSTVQNPFKQT